MCTCNVTRLSINPPRRLENSLWHHTPRQPSTWGPRQLCAPDLRSILLEPRHGADYDY